QAAKICVDTLLQETVEDDYRGRVFSVYDTLVNVSFATAAGVAAVVLPDDGRSVGVLLAIAAGYAVTGVGYGLGVRRRAPSEPPGIGTLVGPVVGRLVGPGAGVGPLPPSFPVPGPCGCEGVVPVPGTPSPPPALTVSGPLADVLGGSELARTALILSTGAFTSA